MEGYFIAIAISVLVYLLMASGLAWSIVRPTAPSVEFSTGTTA